MKVLFAGQVPKDPIYPDAIEDAFVIEPTAGRAALSDGASESFDSSTWSRLLVERFVENSALDEDWLSEAVETYLARFDVDGMSWSKQAAFERGSFATLLGVEFFPLHQTVDVLCVGDSLAVLLDEDNLVASYPYVQHSDFLQRPELFCTSMRHNSFFSSSDFFFQHHVTWDLRGRMKPIFLCMTDALGEWALKKAAEGEPQWGALSSISDVSQLEAVVLAEREKKHMRIDDVSLLVLGFDRDFSDELPQS